MLGYFLSVLLLQPLNVLNLNLLLTKGNGLGGCGDWFGRRLGRRLGLLLEGPLMALSLQAFLFLELGEERLADLFLFLPRASHQPETNYEAYGIDDALEGRCTLAVPAWALLRGRQGCVGNPLVLLHLSDKSFKLEEVGFVAVAFELASITHHTNQLGDSPLFLHVQFRHQKVFCESGIVSHA